ncbi:MAG: hypothetical protein DMF06_04975 [Verrucomicrobia bacterium]|nr:MAG: hypothetical protein DMF06_04975 [Verrucomicrobiota bacterium]
MATRSVNLAPTPVRAKPYVPPKPFQPPTQVNKAWSKPTRTPPKAKPAAHEYPSYGGPDSAAFAASPLLNPKELDRILEVAPFVRIEFESEKKLMSFRANLYAVNVQGKFRYATRREGWTGLVIIRMK